jgi:hypothetical protein
VPSRGGRELYRIIYESIIILERDTWDSHRRNLNQLATSARPHIARLRSLNDCKVEDNLRSRITSFGRELPHALPTTVLSVPPPVGNVSRADPGVQRDHPSAIPSIISIEPKRTPTWMTRDFSAVLNNLQISAARWRFSTCSKNPCADMPSAQQPCCAPLSCPSSLRDFFVSALSERSNQSSQTSGEYSLGSRFKFRVQLGQHLHRDL